VATPGRLEPHQQRALATPDNPAFVSSVTVWEIAIKQAIGRLVFPMDQLDDVMRRLGFDILPILPAHAIVAGSLPRHHGDPFDRMLVAQAMVENLTLVTSDSMIARYDARILSTRPLPRLG
jgi:PIN domain nuclease of toxin-antitoxin system